MTGRSGGGSGGGDSGGASQGNSWTDDAGGGKQFIATFAYNIAANSSERVTFLRGEWVLVYDYELDDLTIQFDAHQPVTVVGAGMGLNFSYDQITLSSVSGGGVAVMVGRGCKPPFLGPFGE